MYRIAAGLLNFASGNRLTINNDRLSKIEQNLFKKWFKTFKYFFIYFEGGLKCKTKTSI